MIWICARWALFRMFVMAIAYSLSSTSHQLCCFSCYLCLRVSVGHSRGSSGGGGGFIVIAFSYLNGGIVWMHVWKFKRLFDWFVYCSWLSLVCRFILIIPSFSILILFSFLIWFWLRAKKKKKVVCRKNENRDQSKAFTIFSALHFGFIIVNIAWRLLT